LRIRPLPGGNIARVSYELVCEGVGHRFGRRKLFADIDLQLGGTGSICITGPNGSGKSTFLKLLVGLLAPTRGRVIWTAEGNVLAAPQVRTRLGFVSPDLQLYSELSARENLTFFARLRRVPQPDRDWSPALAEVGLEGRADETVGNFSSGQRQRMKYLVATLHDPPFLLLDEPSSNLDSAGRDLVERVVSRQRQRGLLIVATNDREEYRFGDRVVSLVE
jgi:heme exporter protein A